LRGLPAPDEPGAGVASGGGRGDRYAARQRHPEGHGRHGPGEGAGAGGADHARGRELLRAWGSAVSVASRWLGRYREWEQEHHDAKVPDSRMYVELRRAYDGTDLSDEDED